MENNAQPAREFRSPTARGARTPGFLGASAVFVALALLPLPAFSQDPARDARTPAAATTSPTTSSQSTLEQRLAELNVTLERMARLLERQLVLQQTDLFYRRLDFLDSSLSSDRRALREARERLRQEEVEAKNLDMMLAQFEEQMAKLQEDDENLAYLRIQQQEMTNREEVLEDSRRELTVYISELESRIRRQEEDLAALHEELSEQ